jgi:STE24 endopeptidase
MTASARIGFAGRSAEPERPLLPWPLAAALALAVAYLATVLLSPGAQEVVEPRALEGTSLFSDDELERARGFRRPQLLIGLGPLVAQIGVLGWWTARPPAWLTKLRRPLMGAAAAGAAVSLATTAIGLPLGVVARIRALDAGLSTRSWAGWAWDVILGAAVGALLTAFLAVVALALIRRLRRWWWLPGSGVVLLASAAMLFAQPIVLDPLFNRFQPLPDGAVRADAVALAREAGVAIGSIEVVDASKRTTSGNAYVAGLSGSRRVVVYDNVLRDFPRAEVRSILAHELAHQRFDDLARGLLYVALVAPFGLLAVDGMQRRFARRRIGTPASLPALALSFVLMSTSITWISNDLSRRVEARADAWALEATDDPKAFSALHRRLALRNLSDPDPPAAVRLLLSTHPSTVERIGMARAYAGD